MTRIRIAYSKTGAASFISHLDMPMIMARSARRAGLVPELTQGFTPRARLALGPPLPAGVEGLAEPADFWFTNWSPSLLAPWRDASPPGIEIADRWRELPPEGPSLSKECRAALCEITPLGAGSAGEAATCLSDFLASAGALIEIYAAGGRVFVASTELERCGPSKMVGALVSAGAISGWEEAAIRRLAVGTVPDIKIKFDLAANQKINYDI